MQPMFTEAEFEAAALAALSLPEPQRAPLPAAQKALLGPALAAVGPYLSLIATIAARIGVEVATETLPKIRDYVASLTPSNVFVKWLYRGLLGALDALIAAPELAKHLLGK